MPKDCIAVGREIFLSGHRLPPSRCSHRMFDFVLPSCVRVGTSSCSLALNLLFRHRPPSVAARCSPSAPFVVG